MSKFFNYFYQNCDSWDHTYAAAPWFSEDDREALQGWENFHECKDDVKVEECELNFGSTQEVLFTKSVPIHTQVDWQEYPIKIKDVEEFERKFNSEILHDTKIEIDENPLKFELEFGNSTVLSKERTEEVLDRLCFDKMQKYQSSSCNFTSVTAKDRNTNGNELELNHELLKLMLDNMFKEISKEGGHMSALKDYVLDKSISPSINQSNHLDTMWRSQNQKEEDLSLTDVKVKEEIKVENNFLSEDLLLLDIHNQISNPRTIVHKNSLKGVVKSSPLYANIRLTNNDKSIKEKKIVNATSTGSSDSSNIFERNCLEVSEHLPTAVSSTFVAPKTEPLDEEQIFEFNHAKALFEKHSDISHSLSSNKTCLNEKLESFPDRKYELFDDVKVEIVEHTFKKESDDLIIWNKNATELDLPEKEKKGLKKDIPYCFGSRRKTQNTSFKNKHRLLFLFIMANIEISLYDILAYIGEKTRPLKEGEEVFKAGHIILCGLEALDTKKIKALCLQTSGLTSEPHEITIELDNNVKNWKCICSCKAGLSGVCKHIVAALIYVNRNADLDIVSCTDLAQKWGKEKKGLQETYKVVPFKFFCHPKTKNLKVNFKTSPEVDKENFDLLSTGVAESVLTKFLSRKKNRDIENIDPETDDAVSNRKFISQVEIIIKNGENTTFLNNIYSKIDIASYGLLPCCENNLQLLKNCNVLEIATQYQQGSSNWAKERQLRITGSTCYSIFTFKKSEDWESKSKRFFFPKHFSNKFVEHGRIHEKDALKCYISKYGCDVVTPGLIVNKMMPWLAFSPDGVIFKDDRPSELLEIKCPFIGKEKPHEIFLEACDFINKNDSVIQLKKKHQYYGQVQLGMALLGLRKTKLIVYSSFSKTFLEISVDFDEDFSNNLIKKVTDNYFQSIFNSIFIV